MTTTTTAREQLLRDILTTAVEGGINYWANDLDASGRQQVRRINRDTNGDVLSIIFDRLAVEDVSGATTQALETPLDEEGTRLVINATALERACERVAHGTVKAGDSVRAVAQVIAEGEPEEADEVDYDAGDADALVQAALFGDIVYG